jgi:phosphatidylserine synthase
VNYREKVAGVARVAGAPSNLSQLPERGQLYNGFGDSMARAFEFAVTPAIFAAVGYGLDRWLGILPVLTIVLFLACVVGMFAKTWCTYEARMQAEDALRPWARAGSGSGKTV